jgi:thiamine biosynthesis lipoprotein
MTRALKKLNILLLASALILLAGCSGMGVSDPEPVMGDGYYLDTVCSISIYRMADAGGEVKAASEMSEDAQAAIDEAFELCKALEAKVSRTRKDSDISNINNAKGGWVEVSDDTREFIQKGLEYSGLSDGGFDITVGGVTEQWDFHAPEGEAKIPDADALAEAAKHIGYENVDVDGNKVRLKDPGAKIDLGGIAKGYIADRITEYLADQGVTDAIVNLGGNIEALGGKPENHLKPQGDKEGGTVRLGINDPRDDSGKLLKTFDTRDVTVVTSGTYERFIEVDGVRYHHILDPATGYPVDNGLVQVTVVAGKGHSVDCDGLSTVCLALGEAEGRMLIDELSKLGTYGPIWAIFVTEDGEVTEAGDPSIVG